MVLPLDPAFGCDGRRPELQRAAALEHDVRLGLERVDVRDDAALAAIALNPVEARALRAGGRGDGLVPIFVERDVVERNDVLRPLARIGELELADLRLDVPRVVDAAFDPRPAQANRLRARQPAVLDRMPRAEDEVLEPVWPALERVLVVVCDLNDRIAGPNLANASKK